MAVSGKSNWELLDSLIHRLFKEYLMRIDPIGNLGLGADSIEFYQVSSRPIKSIFTDIRAFNHDDDVT